VTDSARKLWSVTTLIGNGVPKPALVGWAARVVAEYAVDEREAWEKIAASDRDAAVSLLSQSRYRKTDKASARGVDVHAIVEQIALGDDPEVPAGIEGYVQQFRRFLADHEPTYLLAEAPIYNLELGYAGTLDAVVEIRGRKFVLDVKTTDKKPSARSRPPYPEVALQLAAYARAELVGLAAAERHTGSTSRYYVYDPTSPTEAMPEVEGAFALAISPYDYRLVPARIDDSIWSKFLAAREVALWMLESSKEALGRPFVHPSLLRKGKQHDVQDQWRRKRRLEGPEVEEGSQARSGAHRVPRRRTAEEGLPASLPVAEALNGDRHGEADDRHRAGRRSRSSRDTRARTGVFAGTRA
jgi:hypothetical protein